MKGIDATMVEQAEHEATMEEIVVALRETRRDASRMPPFAVVGGRPNGSWPSAVTLRTNEATATPRNSDLGMAQATADWDDVAELRDAEIERLLADNARLNERIVFLLKVIDREQRRNAPGAADHPGETDRGAVVSGVKAALEAELRPILMVLLRLLEKQNAGPAAPASVAAVAGPDAARSNPSGTAFWGAPSADRRRDR